MRDYITSEWEDIVRFNKLEGFDSLWNLQADWFEPPNERRGGWSGVARIELSLPNGGKEAVFLKRQKNHTRRTLRNPFHGEPTFAGEIKNILLLQQAGVPTLDPLYYGQRKVNGKWRAILVTRELAGFRPMDELIEDWIEQGWDKSISVRKKLITTLALATSRMHEHKLVHNSFHPKHVFVRITEGSEPEVCFIDLEKMRRAISSGRAMRRDLDSLNRRTAAWSNTDRLRFLKGYLDGLVMRADERELVRYLAAKRTAFLNKRVSRG